MTNRSIPSGRRITDADTVRFRNASERTAYERFRDELQPLGWHIAHNLYVSRRSERGRSVRELDLLLIHPEHGVILVEVKGGRLERRANGWFQGGKAMERSPVEQAASALGVLRKAVKQHPELQVPMQGVPMTWMLCLPDGDLTIEAGVRVERSLAIGSDQVVHRTMLRTDGAVAAAVGRYAARHARRVGSSADDDPGIWVDTFIGSLIGDLDFSTSMVGDLEVDLARLAADERIHADWVENLGGLSRLHFEAGAGGGKSVVARLRALSLARSGHSVLMVCSTAGLAKSFQRDVQDRSNGRVRANTLHQTLILAARASGRPEAFGVPAEGAPTTDALKALRSRIAEIAAATPDRYDALILDEAQDFSRDEVNALMGFLRDPVSGSIWSFGDAFQYIPSRGDAQVAEGLLPMDSRGAAPGSDTVVIRQNHRNPEPVFRLAEGLRADGIARVSRKGEMTSKRIDYRVVADLADQREALEAVLEELAQQSIPQGRIGVVTMGVTAGNPLFMDRRPRGARSWFWLMGNPQLDKDGKRDPKPVESLEAASENEVYFDSARRMKGLERGVVILVDVPDPGPVGSLERRLLYAGVTRATTYLCVIATKERIAALKAIAAAWKG